ncbi:hypothetical protein [Siansivirga zeaxanthinifaciens]|uniref:Riboflavin synthase subunit beta n=1 Tax=Siansivirga zeaxanthinifaciens CC-SAMT-1 TaxID=1454006 RepID=A0A0C5VX59_9FLAO|nr:hypothetical protein [Siansivirga zeaxanthinifaciens]AJR03696.1 riboflavin synthase subunit beta [Siansivirga zeaxanthinifaciens CC-SAMT-1]
MGLLKQRKNKKFSYQPRYFNDNGEGNPFEIKHKFDEFRKTVGPNVGLKTKFKNALDDLKNNRDKETNRRILIIVLILVFLFLLIIDFDLSIFFK